MSKENLLKEFDKTTEVGNGGITFETLRNLFIKAINKTREETIMEIASKLPRQVIGANLNIEKILNKLKK